MGFLSAGKEELDMEIERLIDLYGNDVLRVAYMYIKDRQKAEDVFQEVFIKVYKKLYGFKGECSEKTWILKITINTCRDLLKSSWFKKVLSFENVQASPVDENFEVQALQNIENNELFNTIMDLPSIYKEVIIAYYYQQLNTVETGKALGISEGTVRSRLFRARELLKKNLTDRGEKYDGYGSA